MRGDHPATISGAIALLELARRTGLSDAGTFGMLLLTGPAIASGDFAEAARLYGSVRRVMPVAEISLGRAAMDGHRARIEITKQHLGAETYERVAHGASLWTWDEAIFAALDWATRTAATMSNEAPVGAGSAQAAVRDVLEPSNLGTSSQIPLSERELEVLRSVATGATNAEMRSSWSFDQDGHALFGEHLRQAGRARPREATAWAYRHNLLSTSQPI